MRSTFALSVILCLVPHVSSKAIMRHTKHATEITADGDIGAEGINNLSIGLDAHPLRFTSRDARRWRSVGLNTESLSSLQRSTTRSRFTRHVTGDASPLPAIASGDELCSLFSEAMAAIKERSSLNYHGFSGAERMDGFKRATRQVPNLFRVPYEVRRAPGKGLGVFAITRIAKGARVYGGNTTEIAQTYLAVPPHLVNTALKDAAASFSEGVANHFSMYIEKDFYAKDFAFIYELGDDRYMNDDKEATLDEQLLPDGSLMTFATRQIESGEELTVDYSQEVYDDKTSDDAANVIFAAASPRARPDSMC